MSTDAGLVPDTKQQTLPLTGGTPPPEAGKPTGTEAAPTQKATTTEGTAVPVAAEKPPEPELSLKLPDGVVADEALSKEFLPLAKELGLKQDGVQKLTDIYLKGQAGVAERAHKAVADQDAQWKAALKSDPEIGGEKLEQHLVVARKAIAQFGSPALSEFLSSTGLTNHPEVVRFCHRIGKALAEDSVAGTSGANANGATPKSGDAALVDSLYTHPTSQKYK